MLDFTPSDEQARAIAAIVAWYKSGSKQFFYLGGYAGSGKAQPLDAEIQTPTGPRRMGDIRVNDLVIGSQGQSVRVTGVYPQGIKPTYRVTFRDGSTTECCDEHLWMVQTPKDKQRKTHRVIRLTEMIKTGTRYDSGPYRYYVPLTKPVEYAPRELPIAPYSLGVLLGDGYLGGNTPAVTIADSEHEILDRLVQENPDVDMTKFNQGSGCRQYRMTRHMGTPKNNPMMDKLKAMNLSVGGGDKHIPTDYLLGSIEQRIDLLRGLMDSDGSITKNRVSYATGSTQLAQGIISLVQSLGGTAIWSTYTRAGKKPEHHINIKMMINPFWLSRKSSKWSVSWKNPPSRAIISIDRVENKEQQCIMVDADDHLYLTDSYIVTHNTSIAKLAVASCGLDPDSSRVMYASYTWKAATVLRQKGMDASTVHSLIYVLQSVDPKKPDQMVFGLNKESALMDANLLVLDECSMIDEKIARDLLSFGKKILVLGDPGQLPPIKGTGFFTNRAPDYFLKEIHRQALESSIIRLAHDVRQFKPVLYGDYGDVRKVRMGDFSDEQFMAADQIMTGTHKVRHMLNGALLEMHGYDVTYPFMPGVKLICLRNNRDWGIYNGLIGKSMDLVDPIEINETERWFTQRVHIEEGLGYFYETVPLRMNMGAFEDHWLDRPEATVMYDAAMLSPPHFRDSELEANGPMQAAFDFGYAITVHKAQGSQWPSVVIFDDNHLHWKREERARWLYTAMTRATTSLDIVTE